MAANPLTNPDFLGASTTFSKESALDRDTNAVVAPDLLLINVSAQILRLRWLIFVIPWLCVLHCAWLFSVRDEGLGDYLRTGETTTLGIFKQFVGISVMPIMSISLLSLRRVTRAEGEGEGGQAGQLKVLGAGRTMISGQGALSGSPAGMCCSSAYRLPPWWAGWSAGREIWCWGIVSCRSRLR